MDEKFRNVFTTTKIPSKGDPVLLALKADQDKPSRWLVGFSMHSATYSSHSLLPVFVLGISLG